MIGNILVVFMILAAICAGIWCWWVDNHDSKNE